VLKNLIITSLLLFGNILGATYVYEADQDLYDLQTNSSGSTGLGSNDDSVSPAFNLGFTFTFYGNDFTQARMATNGCLHFNLTGSYCGDYTPDPLPQYTNTLFPFWTDLIKDGGSAMRAKVFDDYTIFGWYKMREYNRSGSDNSIEVWLYPNNTFEYRYGELDIKTHDVLIGEQGPTTSDIYTYLFFDECNTGTTNISGTCVSYDWNSSSNAANTLLENGGSLYGLGSGNYLDCSSPLNNQACAGYAAAYLVQQCGLSALYASSCTGYGAAYLSQQCGLNTLYASSCEGYAVAYLAQQCGLNDLYDTACTNYDTAYRIQQCDEDAQYSPTCNGYVQDTVATYYVEDIIDYGYEDTFADNCIDNPSYCYDDDPYADMYFTDSEWYEIDIQEFGQEQVDDWYGSDVTFNSEGGIVWDDSELDSWEELDQQMDVYDEFVELNFYEDDPLAIETYEDEIFNTYEEHYDVDYDLVYNVVGEEEEFRELYEFNTIITEEIEYEEEDNYLAFENEEELDEWFEEEMEESQETIEEQFVEAEEESYEEEAIEEEWIAEANEEEVVLEDLEEVELVGTVEREEGSSMDMETALSVVASTVQAATASVSGTTAGTSIHATGNTVASGGSVGATTTTTVSSSVSSGGISTSSSPSISAQVSAAAIQTQNILSTLPDTMTTTSSIVETSADVEVTSSSVVSASTENTDTGTSSSTVDTSTATLGTAEVQVAVVEVQVQNMQVQIDSAVVDAGTASEADQIADQIIAQNIQSQQEEAETYQQETGQYGDESALVAYLGYNAGFTDYYGRSIPSKEEWYEPRVIYADAYIGDNINAFYQLAGSNLNTLQQMRDLQPTL